MINSVIQLIVPFYKDKNPERNNELLKVLSINCNLDLIDRIVLLIDGDIDDVSHPKIIKWMLDSRPTYSDAFRIASDLLSESDGITLIANADIYFKDEDLRLIDACLTPDTCFALSRWENSLTHHKSWDSQDTWCFRGPIRDVYGDFLFGMPGCDNRIAYEIESVGYKVENPSCSIKTYHLHKSNVRNYVRDESTVVPKPYKLVNCTYLGGGGVVGYPVESLKNKSSDELIDNLKLEYSYNNQKAIMQSLASKDVRCKFLLAVCIPTMNSRNQDFSRLISQLNTQISKYGLIDTVQFIIERDGGLIPIGGKRNHAVIRADSEYVVFIDDDDSISEDYLQSIVSSLLSVKDVDCVTIEATTYIDGKLFSNIVYEHNPNTDKGQFYEKEDCDLGVKIMKKSPGHLCAIKRKIMLQVPFPVIWGNGGDRKQRADNGSDVQQLLNLKNSGLIKTSVHIKKPIYTYKYKQNK